MIPVVGLGAGGHAQVLIELLRATEQYVPVALLDPCRRLWGTRVLDVPVLGDDDQLAAVRERGVNHAFVGVGSIGDSTLRADLFQTILDHGMEPIRVVSPVAHVSPSAHLGQGAAILPLALVHTGVRVGDNAVVNSGAIVEHHCTLGDHVHIAPGAKLASAVVVGASAHIGIGATVRQSVRIGPRAVIGAGAAVVSNVAAGTTVVGVPAAPVKVPA